MHEKQPSSRYDELISSSFQSVSSRSIFKSQSTFSNKNAKTLKLAPINSPDRPQKTRNRINYLALPRGHQRLSTSTFNHTHSSSGSPSAVDMFGSLEDVTNIDTSVRAIPEKTTDDKRFWQLIHTFSEVHERDPTNVQTLKNVIQSNASLQGDSKREQMMNMSTSIVEEDEEGSLIDVTA